MAGVPVAHDGYRRGKGPLGVALNERYKKTHPKKDSFQTLPSGWI